MPIQPLFIYDGPNKPTFKRNRTVNGTHQSSATNRLSKKLLQLFRFPYLTAPGEAEAECAVLQKENIVDAIMSEDVDTLMFGAKTVLKDWSSEGNRGNKSPTHVSVLDADKIRNSSGLDPYGMILVALLSGGDYDTNGIDGFGPGLACEIAKAGFGKDMIRASLRGDARALTEWRERLHRELRENEKGFFRRKSKALIPISFPNETLLSYYTNPTISSKSELDQLKTHLHEQWDQDIDIPALREFTANHFDWKYKTGAKKFIRSFAPAILAYRSRRKLYEQAPAFLLGVCDRRQHFDSDAMPELRLEIIPREVVGLNLDEEQDNPGFSNLEAGRQDDENLSDVECHENNAAAPRSSSVPPSPRRMRKSPSYNPSLPEKIWLPESIVKLGMSAMVEGWEMRQQEIPSDRKQFATRNCPKPTNTLMMQGPIMNFLKVQKSVDPELISFDEKSAPLIHKPNRPPPPVEKAPDVSRPAFSKNALSGSRRKGAGELPSRVDPSINPFSIAQRSKQMSQGPGLEHKSPNLERILSSNQQRLPEKRSRHMTSDLDIDMNGIRPRQKKQGLQKAYTDPISIDISPPARVDEPPSIVFESDKQSHQPPKQPKPTTITSDEDPLSESGLDLLDTGRGPYKPGQLPSRVQPPEAFTPSVPSTQSPAGQSRTLTHKAVASRSSLPGYYRVLPQTDGDSVDKSQTVMYGRAARVSLIDLT